MIRSYMCAALENMTSTRSLTFKPHCQHTENAGNSVLMIPFNRILKNIWHAYTELGRLPLKKSSVSKEVLHNHQQDYF